MSLNKFTTVGNIFSNVAAITQTALTNAVSATANGAIEAGVASAAQTQTTLTHAVGTADGTVQDVSGSFDQTILNNNFKEITTELALVKTDVAATITAINALVSATDNNFKEITNKLTLILADSAAHILTINTVIAELNKAN